MTKPLRVHSVRTLVPVTTFPSVVLPEATTGRYRFAADLVATAGRDGRRADEVAGLFTRLERETHSAGRPEALAFAALGLAAVGWPAWECLSAAAGF